ncbi:MAG: hypothetical protein EOM73_09195 [Bacteroidia bacterium]|nr:hypothetical protein [Bacteroidia bacterium]
MWQEIITYLIITGAVVVAVLKSRKKFRKKKQQALNYKNAALNKDHNCSDCMAECILRDTVAPQQSNNGETVCSQTEKKSDGF